MKILQRMAMVMGAVAMIGILGCYGEKVIIPVYDTAMDQFVFAKRIKDHAYLVADKSKRKTEFKHAILAYQKVLELFPDDEKFAPLALASMADSYFEIEQFGKAAKTYERVLKKYPDQNDIQASALYGAGVVYDRMGKHAKAQSYFKDCIERFANNNNPFIKDLVERSKIQYGTIKKD
jgi:tetratricopeptide (TPR) repeat protein